MINAMTHKEKHIATLSARTAVSVSPAYPAGNATQVGPSRAG